MMEKEEAKRILNSLIRRIAKLQNTNRGSSEFEKWKRDTKVAISNIFKNNPNYLKDFERILFSLSIVSNLTPKSHFQDAYVKGLENSKAILKSMIEEIDTYWPSSNKPRKPVINNSSATVKTSSNIPIPSKISPINMFYSYATEDEELKKELEKHLSLLKRQGILSSWHFRKITGGKEWKDEIDARINHAKMILLLISADFLSSDYCYDIEMKTAMDLHEQKLSRVIPVILRPVDWHDSPFGKLEALPKDGKPITTWSNQDTAFLDVTNGIRQVVLELRPSDSTETRTPSIVTNSIQKTKFTLMTSVCCTRCGVKAGGSSYCNNIHGHDFQSFTGDVYCTRCGIKAGGSSYCNNIHSHDFQSFTGDVYCTRCGIKAGGSSYCNNIHGHDFQSFTK